MKTIIAGQGEPVVLLHSSMSSKEQWLKLIQLLEKNYQVIAIDLYGYGASEYPPDPASFSLLDEANRFLEIITSLIGEQQFHLIGHSYGGATALRFAYAEQERLLSLSVYEPVAFHLLAKSHPSYAPIKDIAERVDRELEQDNASAATEQFVDFWSGSGTYAKLNGKRQGAFDRVIEKVSLDFQAIMNEPLSLEDYSSITLPLCVIAGKASRAATQKIAQDLFATLPQTSFHWVEGGHMAPIARADLVNPIWERFLRSL